MKTRALLLVVLVLLAGCGGSIDETEPTTVATTQTPTATDTPTEQTTQTTTEETTAETTTVDDSPNNPWEKENVTVAVWGSFNQSRDFAGLVNESLIYWNGNASKYGTYDATFVLTPNARGADIVVQLVPRIRECGIDDGGSTVGCASVLRPYSTPDTPEKVRVVAGYSNESTVKILKHEFGHIMGVEHGEEPMPLMEPIAQHTYLSQPDVSDRAVPWQTSNLSVYVSTENVTSHDNEEFNEQVDHALSYYEEGADGAVPENVTFTRTENRSAADIRISFPDDPIDCGGSRMHDGSCGWYRAYDTDVDDAFEYYSHWDIRVRNIDEDAVGWHVGSWLGNALGLEGDGMPEPFVDADYRDRRSDWWE